MWVGPSNSEKRGSCVYPCARASCDPHTLTTPRARLGRPSPRRQGDVKAPSPGDGADGVAAVKGAALREALARLLRTPADHLQPWRGRLGQGLGAMGAAAAADAAQRQLERYAARWGLAGAA